MISDAILDAAQALRSADRVLLACHINPDGDTMGSALALALGLRGQGKEVDVVCPDPAPPPYHFMPGATEILPTAPERPYPVAVALDCDGIRRLGSVGPAVRSAPCVIEIDHHPGVDRYGNILVLDRTASATGELVMLLLRLLAIPLTADIATNLYVALMTDTGSFRYANTTARTLRLAAELVEAGADSSAISEQVYETRPYAAVALLGRALASLRRSEDGAIAWAKLTQEDFEGAGATDAETEGIVNHVRSIEGVRLALLFRQVNGRVRVSLRSREPVDAAAVARAFSGGGHRVAAGCILAATLPEAEKRVLAEARKAVDS